MNQQECITITNNALKYLGRQGGTIWQIEKELQKRTGIVRRDDVHVYIRDMLVVLGVMKND